MFDIKIVPGNEVYLTGRFDALQKEKALAVFDEIDTSYQVNFKDLEYISSAGLSVLLLTQKRLKGMGHQLVLKNLSRHVREIFHYAGFDLIFEITENEKDNS